MSTPQPPSGAFQMLCKGCESIHFFKAKTLCFSESTRHLLSARHRAYNTHKHEHKQGEERLTRERRKRHGVALRGRESIAVA